MRVVSTVFAAVLALVLQGGFAGARADSGTGGHCTGMNVTDFFISKADDQTQSVNFVNITDGALHFTTSSIGCVIITFAAPADVGEPGGDYAYLFVRTVLDGNQLCDPLAGQNGYTFVASGQPPPVVAASVTHTCKNVPAGNHSVQVQFAVGSIADNGELIGHTLTVTHN